MKLTHQTSYELRVEPSRPVCLTFLMTSSSVGVQVNILFNSHLEKVLSIHVQKNLGFVFPSNMRGNSLLAKRRVACRKPISVRKNPHFRFEIEKG